MKTIEVYMEREIRYSPDKRSLVGTILIDNIEISFRLLLSAIKTEKMLVLLNNPIGSISINLKNAKNNLRFRESEYILFYDFFFRLANNFFKCREDFRRKYSKARSDGPDVVMFAGKVELSVLFCQILNKYFGLRINIPRKNYRHQENKNSDNYFVKKIENTNERLFSFSR